VVERFFGTLKYEHLYRAIIADGDALASRSPCSGRPATHCTHTRPSATTPRDRRASIRRAGQP
jgi:hypothetical protein